MFQEKVVLITGGTSGIGKETALEFARRGAAVAFTGRRRTEGEQVVAQIKEMGGNALFIQSDIAKPGEASRMVEETITRFGKLHFAFNNAGIEGARKPIQDLTEEEFDEVFTVNVKGVYLSMRYEVPAILRSGGGVIVNCSSVAGLRGMANGSAYMGSKHAVLGMTKSVALELARKGIRVVAICPAGVSTELHDRFINHDPEALRQSREAHPVGRIAEPQEIARVVAFLCSDDASFMTGTAVVTDGGLTVQL